MLMKNFNVTRSQFIRISVDAEDILNVVGWILMWHLHHQCKEY